MIVLLTTVLAFGQQGFTSFEEPDIFNTEYTDTGDPNIAHPLFNNPNEPFVNFPETNGELGYNARYEPYDTPGVGLTDGDLVGVTDIAPTASDPFPDGNQGYQISDVDGNFILEFDVITSFSTGPAFFIDYFISETGYEGDGTTNESGSDRLRIYVKDLTNNTEFDILDTSGSDINSLLIEGSWISDFTELTPFNGTPIDFQLVIEARNNSSEEAFFFDNVNFEGLLNIDSIDEKQFTILPNPAENGYVDIFSKIDGVRSIRIYDVLGNELMWTELIQDRLDISYLNSGIYILKISQNGRSATKKLIVR